VAFVILVITDDQALVRMWLNSILRSIMKWAGLW
jgi:hypothetical protein